MVSPVTFTEKKIRQGPLSASPGSWLASHATGLGSQLKTCWRAVPMEEEELLLGRCLSLFEGKRLIPQLQNWYTPSSGRVLFKLLARVTLHRDPHTQLQSLKGQHTPTGSEWRDAEGRDEGTREKGQCQRWGGRLPSMVQS